MNKEEITPEEQPEKKKPEKVLDFFDTKKEPRKSLSNFHRNQYRLLTTSLSMADRKAMILIRLNGIIVPVMIISKDYVQLNVQHGSLIIFILTAGSGVALILGLMAASPMSTIMYYLAKKHILKVYPEWKYHCMFLFKSCPLSEYEKAMKEVVNSQDLQIGNQVRMFYIFTKYLYLKYFVLDWAFRIFLLTIMVCIILFLIGHSSDCPFFN